ncbi:MAG: S-methyl-5-thioribose-1-phosphate isomerase, partial [Planctomycetota bacterium]
MAETRIQSIAWLADHTPRPVCRLLDQTKLPLEEAYLDCATPEQMHDAIVRLVVRGAPAIGVAAAYGVVLGALTGDSLTASRQGALGAAHYLATSRPTAVNLFHVLERMRRHMEAFAGNTRDAFITWLLDEATAIHREDAELCAAIGRAGAPLIRDGMTVLTHCHTGAAATGGIGTALGVLATAHADGRRFSVLVCETRPLLQGARLTAWELMRLGIDARLITDSTAGHCMARGMVDLVIVGADRIAANGDTANKIGTYSHAVLAQHHGVPFYVAAPRTTFDTALPAGDGIEIEERGADEIAQFGARRTAPPGGKVFAPAYDVTPAAQIAGSV